MYNIPLCWYLGKPDVNYAKRFDSAGIWCFVYVSDHSILQHVQLERLSA